MNKVSLEKIIYKNYLKTSLASIFFIEIVLIFIYFSSNSKLINTTIDFVLNDIKLSVYDRVDSITDKINERFKNLENITYLLQNEHQNFFKYKNNITLTNPPIFDYAKNGMYYKIENNGGSSVVVSKNTVIDNSFKEKLFNTELFDNNFKSIVEQNDVVEAIYFNSHDDFCRYYPFLENSYNTFPSDIKMKNYNFYYEADLKHNPEKKAVWTDVYVDPAGKGWMISSIIPIYNEDFLEGVTGIDITLNSIIKKLLSLELPFNGSSLIVDKKGDIVVVSKKIEDILKIKTDYYYDYSTNKKIEKTILKGDKSNIFNHHEKSFVQNLKSIIQGKEHNQKISIKGKDYLIFSKKVDITDWYLISIIPEENIIAEVKELEEKNLDLGYMIIVLTVIFYILFFIFLYKKAKDFVKEINNPLLKIVNFTKSLGVKKDVEPLKYCGIHEIDSLNDNFNKLAKELEKRTEKLIESEEKRKENEKLANTDQLTKVYNRRFLEDFSNKYMKIVKREHTNLSLLIIDIDDFKNVNDTYGHEIGDAVIKLLVKRLKNTIRENDLIVRYGGDEFVVLLPNTDNENAKKVGNKLLDVNHSLNKFESDEFKISISIGVASYNDTDLHINEIINRADKALYQAKKHGKNCLI